MNTFILSQLPGAVRYRTSDQVCEGVLTNLLGKTEVFQLLGFFVFYI